MREGAVVRQLLASVATVAILLGACSTPTVSVPPSTGPTEASPSPDASFEPIASVAASAGPSPSVAPSATAAVGTLDAFPPGAAVQVAVKDLNIRKNPSTSAKRVTTVSRGDVLVISPIDNTLLGFGPVSKNGYAWYPVVVTTLKNGTLPALPASPPAGAVTDRD
jgi:hypothetical protein